MIALDTSAIVAVLMAEEEADAFLRMIVSGASVGAPTLVETRLVLESRAPRRADGLLHGVVARRSLTIVPFDAAMFEAAADAFIRFGKGRHPAKLNFGDCLSYAVARVHALPLLFKGGDFVHTDIVPAYTPAP